MFLAAPDIKLQQAINLSNGRDYEQSLALLKSIRPGLVKNKAAYFFHRAVAEHQLVLGEACKASLNNLLNSFVYFETPERYTVLARLMLDDLEKWQPKGLDTIARKMDNVERRLSLNRPGKETQKIQREIISRLDELIKEKENAAKGGGSSDEKGAKPGCPQVTKGNKSEDNKQSAQPMTDSKIAGGAGPGKVDQKKFAALAASWGKLPEKERAKAREQIKAELPSRYREAVETYYKKLAQQK